MLKFGFIALSILFTLLSCISQETTTQDGENLPIMDSSHHNNYSWLNGYSISKNLSNRIPVPDGFKRIDVIKGSFGDWLRHLPLKETGAPVLLYNGSLKNRQDVHCAVVEIDPGKEDLQQCADACMRLKAEYHFSKGEHGKIHFKFTNGDIASWAKWMQGYRPIIKGNQVEWVKKASLDSSYKNFKNYLRTVFQFAGTQSLSQELSTTPISKIQPGDIFIKGGFPGHAVMVVDVAENTKTHDRVFILAQSYMPAQEIHILKNFNSESLNPWYSAKFTDELRTPEWTFSGQCLKSFK